MLSIRRATRDDFDVIGHFLDEHLRKDWFMPKQQILNTLSASRSQCFLAYEDCELVGVALAGGKRTTLYNLLVHPQYRSLGIGKLLVQRIDPIRIRAKTNMHSGDPSGFYKKLGYREYYRDARRSTITIFERPPKSGEQLTVDYLINFPEQHESGHRQPRKQKSTYRAKFDRPVRRPHLRRFTGLPPTAVLDANVFIGLQQRLTPVHPLAQLHQRGLSGQIQLYVTPELPQELGRDTDTGRRDFQLGETAKFPVAPPVEPGRLEMATGKLLSLVFPKAKRDSRHMENKISDCRQLAYALETNAEYFVTYDGDLLKKGLTLRVKFGLNVITPESLLNTLEIQARPKVGALVRPSLDIRDGSKNDLERLWEAVGASNGPGVITERIAVDSSTIFKIIEVEGELAGTLIVSGVETAEAEIRLLWIVPKYRRRGLGQHLLQHVLSVMTRLRTAKLVAAVPASLTYVPFFLERFGFRRESSVPHPSPGRVELRFARYFLYETVTESTWDAFTRHFLTSILVLQPTSQPGVWRHLAPVASSRELVRVTSTFGRDGASLRLYEPTDQLLDSWDTFQFEAEFAPLQLAFPGRQAAIVPIRSQWAECLFEYADPQLRLMPTRDKRKLRTDNVYYRAGRNNGHLTRGTPVLWYVSKGAGFSGGLVACAKVISVEIGPAEELFTKYGDLGIYSRDDVLRAGEKSQGKVQAIRFGQVEAFEQPISIPDVQRLLHLKAIPPTATAIPYDLYLGVRNFAALGEHKDRTDVRI